MKKILLSVAAVFAAMSLNAQEVCTFNVDNALGLDADNGTALTAGTVIGETESITATIGADDSYKPQDVAFVVNGTEYKGGLQGSSNPKDADSGTPSSTLVQPASGAFLQFEAKADGFLYVIHKASSNKAYTVFEEGSAVGYTFAAFGNKEPLPEVYQFVIEGGGEYNYLSETDRTKIEFAEQEWLKVNNPEFYEGNWVAQDDGTTKWTNVSAGGLGVIKFAVAKGCKYIVNANGSKITAGGFVFSTEDNILVQSGEVVIYKGEGAVAPAPVEDGETVLYENDFTGITEFTGWTQWDDSQTDGKVEVDPDGIAITVGIQTGQLWQPQLMVVPDGSFNLEEDGNYKVVVTAKFPTAGTLQINMGTWSANDQATFDVEASDDFQEVVCEFPGWSVDAEGAHLLFQPGDFKGTTILKKIQIFKVGDAIEPASDVVWENDGSKGAISWSSDYRFANEEKKTGEEIAAIPMDVWEKMKTTPFFVDLEGENPQIRVTTGWWDTNLTGDNDITPGNELLTDNGDGKWTLKVDLTTAPALLELVDDHHLLFTGDRYTPTKIYFDSATAIQSVKKAVADGAIYNLAGQKVNASYKGVVIKNGKKYFQK